MSYIPDCRSDETYNQKYLGKLDKEFVRGFDWCAENAVDNLFNNLDVYFDDDSYIMHSLSKELPESLKEEYEFVYTFPFRMGDTEKTEKRQVRTYGDLFRSKLLDWMESERDQLITSMIDNMDEDEYNAIRAKVDGGAE